jgi:L-ascorbate metabolism protein UlaG (beta-lactamase superfamily)
VQRILLLFVVGALTGCYPKWTGPKSDHFDGQHFTNHPQQPTTGEFLRWRRTKDQGPWPKQIMAMGGPKPPPSAQCPELRVTFVGHATMLIQTGGVNILTDPMYSERASPVKGVGPKRRRPPGIRFDDLPSIDVVLVSHNHYDHMDLETLRKLSARHKPLILVPLGNRVWLQERDVSGVEELDWWQRKAVDDGVSFMSVPTQHRSGRGLTDRDKALWTGFVIHTPCGKVYFAGDTGFGDHFTEVNKREGPMRLAILPLSDAKPHWYHRINRMNPAQAIEAHKVLQAQTSIAMHFGTFQLGDEGRIEPLVELNKVMPPEIRPHFWVLDEGEAALVPESSPRPPA